MPTSSYWQATRAPRYSLVFVAPLLVLYELLAFALTHDSIEGVRNGADVLLKSLFIFLGGRYGLAAFGVVLIGTGAFLVWRDRRRSGPVVGKYFAWMMAESLLYAFMFGTVVSVLTTLLLRGPSLLMIQAGAAVKLPLPTQLMVSLGAGIYEELLFRVILVGLLAKGASVLLGWSPRASGVFATLVGALMFSAFHYIGPLGDHLELNSFLFRAVAGVLLSALYLLRGFGIAAWTHAMYDVILALSGVG